jgi:pyruvate formate lyase activating enzyme
VVETAATVLNLQRMSTEDGPGIRTTVFFKGCALACRWCHNPESIAMAPQVVWNDYKCMACSGCVQVCPEHALTASDAGNGAEILRDATCSVCGTCVDECPTTAMERLGDPWTLDDLVTEVLKDRAYFEANLGDPGGVTLSGGEPALQANFCSAFAQRLRDLGIHVAVDTCGHCAESKLLSLVRHADLVLYDLKTLDPAGHARLTGHENQRILANLTALATHMASHKNPTTLWIRTPLIPGETDTEANLHAIGAHLAANHPGQVSRWELCTFNNLCADKYRRLGLTWPYTGVTIQSPETLARLSDVARASGVDPAIVHVPGAPSPSNQSPTQEVTP